MTRTVLIAMLLAICAAPARAQRPITFTTTEGTWISLDVTPDGRTIAFELLGDLYTMPMTGGTATPVAQGTAFQSQPRYSPDGKRLAFNSDEAGSE
ncbi:MAG: hypothetical protein U5K74_08255 [Gemmatimonadaceae bacterium]|nr:hypothetical protein [Gemmatimonadaceae bacterium]